MTRQYPDQRRSDSGNCVNDSFRVAGAIVEMTHKQFSVEPCREVLYLVHERNIATRNAGAGHRYEAQQGPIAKHATEKSEQLAATPGPQFQDRGKKIAEPNP